MKVLLPNMIFLFVLVNLFSVNIFPQIEKSNLSKTNPSNISNVDSNKVDINIDDNLCWGNSIYISTGYGTPQGYRFELGYNFGSDISLAATIGIHDHWSRNPKKGIYGIIGKIHLYKSKLMSPYILVGAGSTISIWGEPDSYLLIQIGSKISIYNWLQFCPELGIDFTSKYISGGGSFFGGSSPVVNENKSRPGFNISFEIDFRQIF